MFKQYAIARFVIGFIIFVLTYMVATLSYDTFFHALTAGMFILHLYIMKEVQKGHREELDKKDLECEEKVKEIQELLYQKEAEYELLVQRIIKLKPDEL